MRFVLFVILGYIVYQFIFKLVIPVYMASRKIRKGFQEMSDRMNQQQRQDGTAQPTTPPREKPRPKAGDYIDFEEVK